MKVVYVDLDRCLACLSCQRICTFQQLERSPDAEPNIRVQVDMDQRLILTSTCRQCQSAPCIAVCPTEAMARDPKTGAVVVHRSRCIGCGMCVMMCPFGNVHLEPNLRVAAKCDLCGGDPLCVQVCMAQALHYGDLNDLTQTERGQLRGRLALHAVKKTPPPKED